MRIALFGLNSGTAFSGGRYYAWMLAEALAYAGHEVCYVTNERPFFYHDFAAFPCHRDVRLYLSSDLRAGLPDGDFDIVVMVPDYFSRLSYFLTVAYFGRQRGARLVLLNFETPNWFNALAPEARPAELWRGWLRFSREASMILSCAAESERYARAFYAGSADGAVFTHCHPPINSIVADSVPDRPAEKRIVVITRFEESNHKGAGRIAELLSAAMSGYTLVLMVGSGEVPPSIRAGLTKQAERHGIRLRLLFRLTDREKFQHLKRSCLMLFPSFFEGFGLPPVEAQYCNLPCIAFDLPVLREVSGDGLYYVERGDWEAFRDKIAEVLAADRPHGHLREKIAEVARFDAFAHRIDRVMVRARETPIVQPAKGAFRQRLELEAQKTQERLLRLYGRLSNHVSGIGKQAASALCL